MNVLHKKFIYLFSLISFLVTIGSGAAADEQDVSLVLILAQSGIAAEDNRPAMEAAQLAVNEINAAGGLLGRRLKIQIIDNQSTPLGSRAAAQKAVNLKATAAAIVKWEGRRQKYLKTGQP